MFIQTEKLYHMLIHHQMCESICTGINHQYDQLIIKDRHEME